MVRCLLALVVGLGAAVGAIAGGEFVVSLLYPLPPGVSPTDVEALKSLWLDAPFGAKLGVLVADAVGAMVGGLVVALVARRYQVGLALALAGLLTLAAIANNLMLPSPPWFWIVSLGEFIPAAYAGARLAAWVTTASTITPE